MLDLRHCARVPGKAPGFAAVATLSLALGIGANTAIFSIVKAVILKVLPVRDPERLVSLVLDKSARGKAAEPASYYTNPIWEEIRDHQHVLEGVSAYASQPFDIGRGGQVQRVSGMFVSGRFFDVVGARPWIGRTFTDDDDRRGGGRDGPTAVLGYAFWRDQYGASLVLRDVAFITALGMMTGTALAFASDRLVTGLLYGLTPTDPATAALAVALLGGVALLAGYLPARRAARLDPMIALRDE